ncbi:DUF5681 domain-containing protein [Parafrankia sp. BMG5.11]|uniref:DUF5681 domain-containing protein n=1 Tax=Parafrankia sp. BMG5.11 TaxID=222540 RepID=UPI00103CF48A|nr:DUF5681 domain-containing protein [Parafrankia sp. BMG5.11]TCJ32177.1 hypothetical protein E0504_44380 [Parafrankia sp. BMG5.11]
MDTKDNDSGGNGPPKADTSAVGYGKPPVHSRFQKGASGNPSGRPKKQKSFVEHLEGALSAKKRIERNGKKEYLSIRQISAEQLAILAASGDLKALKMIADLDPLFRPAPEKEGPITFTLAFPEEERDPVGW